MSVLRHSFETTAEAVEANRTMINVSKGLTETPSRINHNKHAKKNSLVGVPSYMREDNNKQYGSLKLVAGEYVNSKEGYHTCP
jgi:hypothetical protein